MGNYADYKKLYPTASDDQIQKMLAAETRPADDQAAKVAAMQEYKQKNAVDPQIRALAESYKRNLGGSDAMNTMQKQQEAKQQSLPVGTGEVQAVQRSVRDATGYTPEGYADGGEVRQLDGIILDKKQALGEEEDAAALKEQREEQDAKTAALHKFGGAYGDTRFDR